MKRIVFELNLLLFFLFFLSIGAGFLGFFVNKYGLALNSHSPEGSIIKYLLATFMLASITATYFMMAVGQRKWAKNPNDIVKMKKYKKFATLRIILIGTGLMLGVGMVFIMSSRLLIGASAVSAVALLLCLSNEIRISKKIQLYEDTVG
jgi:heme A synthase